MKRMIWLALLSVAMVFFLPLLLSVAPMGRGGGETEPESAAPATPSDLTRSPVLDGSTVLTVQTGAGNVEMTMAEYLPCALAGEMPASFEPEALKAQAVALRTYVLHYRGEHKQNHPEADVCTFSGCCAAWTDEAELRQTWGENYDAYMEKLRAAVTETDGQYLVWDAEPILAVFHASSSGCTEDGKSVGTDLPYLISVSTPETAGAVNNLVTTVEVEAEDFRDTVLSICPDADLSGPMAAWVGAMRMNPSGRVSQVQIGGVSVSGLALRQMFALRSTDFTLTWNGTHFVFRVNGYGHGLGMSQYGANLMARSGANYAEILAHYYPDTELVMAVLEQTGSSEWKADHLAQKVFARSDEFLLARRVEM